MGPPEHPPSRRNRWKAWLAGALALAALLTVLCHELLLTVFVVQGASMEPTLRQEQRVLVLRRFGKVKRGDLVVFRNPFAGDQVLVKRVLALPGETIFVRDGQLYVDDLLRAEPYVKAGTTVVRLEEQRLPENTYFVLGDNRNASVDSRKFGPIERNLLIGKVVAEF
jgi:signal peptidase I